MVPNTSDDLPDPETPVNTVSRRLGMSTLTSLRLFSRAPWTRIRSWLSAGCRLKEVMFWGSREAQRVLADHADARVAGARAALGQAQHDRAVLELGLQ